MERAQRASRGGVPPCCRATVPARGFGVVGWQLSALGIEVADQFCGMCVTRRRGAPQPRFTQDLVLGDNLALKERHSPFDLRRLVAELGRLAIVPGGCRQIPLDANPLLGQHSQRKVWGIITLT